MKFNSFEGSGQIKSQFEKNAISIDSVNEKFNPQIEELLKFNIADIYNTDKNESKKAYLHFVELTENSQVLKNEEIKAILVHFLEQMKEINENGYIFKNELLSYISDLKTEDKETKERTLDRSYRILFDLAEDFPREVSILYSGTHYMFEFVKPEVFFDSYLKIKTSEKMGEYKSRFLGEMFSSLEYNMSYCGTEEYINALINKIDFKNAKSCFESSQFMNIAASLADYANSGSYSENYDIGKKIGKMLKQNGSDPEAIYLLGAKAEYMYSRLKKGYPPFVHQRGIFELAPGTLASNKGEELLVSDMSNTETKNDFEKYEIISDQMDTPPKELVERARELGESTVEWTQDPNLARLRNTYYEKIIKNMKNIHGRDVALLNGTKVSKKQLLEYKNLIGTDFRDFLEEEFEIEFKKLKIPEQFFFLEYIQTQTKENVIKLKEFIKKSNNEKEKIDKFKTFLSIEQGGKEMGDKIINLGEKLPEEVAKKVFAKYGEIIDTADNTEVEIKKIFVDKDIPDRVLVSVKENLLKRGAKMLSDLGDMVQNPEFKVNEEEILKELSEIKEETIILGESYVGLYKEGIRVPIEDVTTTKETSTQDLDEKQKTELMEIYEKGRPKVTYENKEHLEFLKEEFKNELNDEDFSVFEICFKEETIIIALVDDKKDKDTLYIGGLTFVEDVKNAVIAEASMSHVIKKFKDKNIKALVDSRNPLLNMYLKRFGFKIIKKLDSPEEMKENAGELYYEIERPKDIKEEKIIGEKKEFEKAA